MDHSRFPGFRKKIDRTDFFWLAYLVFFIIEPLERRSAIYWVETLAIIGLFLVLYVGYLRSESKRWQVSLVGAMVVLGVCSLPFNGGGVCFMIYAAALLPFVVPSVAWVLAGIAALSALVAMEGWWVHFSLLSIFINVFFTVVVGGINISFAQKERENCKLRLKQEEIEALAAVAERERIARDLHDVLGHTLSVIVLKAELAGRLLEREPEAGSAEVSRAGAAARARAEIGDVERTARVALAEVREAIGGYRARGLPAEIEAARQTLQTAGVTLITEGDLRPRSLTAAEETVLALALREAVTNIVRHAQANTCLLSMVVDHGRHRLSIEDDGQHATAREGNGLRGMRERVESLGGQLSLTREGGTHLLIELP